MSESMVTDRRLYSAQWRSPTALIRVASILLVGLMIGHMAAYPWASTELPQESQLTKLMKSVPFEFMGERSSYWHLYFGWGVLVAVLLLTLALILWILPEFAAPSPRSVGAITAIVAISSLTGAYLSFRFFYLPPTILFSIVCVALITATIQLLKHPA